MSVMNTWFKQRERHLYTWKSPRDLYRNQIDYLIINRRYRNSVLTCKTKPSADCNSDHNLLFAKLRCKLKRLRPSKRTLRLDLRTLRSTLALQKHYSIEVQNRFDELENDYSQGNNTDESDPEVKWKMLENALVESAERVIPKKRATIKNKWITPEILDLMAKRRKLKYKKLTNILVYHLIKKSTQNALK